MIETVIIISICSFWFAELSTIPQTIIQWLDTNRLIPFDCSKCLGFWVGVFYIYGCREYEFFYLPLLTSFVSIILSRLYYKFLS